jgi:hypothetical protein
MSKQRSLDDVGVVGTVVSNGSEALLIPESELKRIDAIGVELAEEAKQASKSEPFRIPMQLETVVRGVAGGGIEIEQAPEHGWIGDSEADRIVVEAANVVALARKMLECAGFQDLELLCGRHREEVFDGQTADRFDLTPAPPPILKPPALPRPEPESSSDPNFSWHDDDAVILHEQKCTAVYRNPFGGLVVRQLDEDDSTIVILAENIPTFIARITDVANEH